MGQSTVSVHHFDMISNILDYFGEFMEDVWMGFQTNNTDENRKMIKYLNDRCFKSLKRLNLDYCYGDLLDELKNSFVKVTELSFSSEEKEELIVNEGQSISKLFPNLKSLRIKHPSESDWEFIDGHLPFLTELFWEKEWKKDNISNALMIKFLKKNQQIKIFRMSSAQMTFLRDLSEALPALEMLKIEYFSAYQPNFEDISTIHFNSVKKLSLKTHEMERMIDNCTFNQLDILSLESTEKETKTRSEWLQIISRQINPNLRTLKIKFEKLSLIDLLIIPDKFPYLESVNIECDSIFSHQDIMKFIKMLNNLSTLTLQFEIEESEMYDLRQTLSQNWSFRIDLLYVNRIKLNIYG